MALQVAQEADPGHRFAILLHTTLTAGLPPQAIKSQATTGVRLAAELAG